MHHRFNDAARLVMRLAELFARGRGCDAVDTEHVLLALVQLHDCVAARVLKRSRIDLESVRREVRRLGKPGGAAAEGPLPLTPAVHQALELAYAAARVRLGHPAIGTGHLLLGLLEEAEGVAFTVLCKLGIGRLGDNLSRVAEHVVRETEGGDGWCQWEG
jgi:ATP-dependent Clp protease ATP-binding subunit ClpA